MSSVPELEVLRELVTLSIIHGLITIEDKYAVIESLKKHFHHKVVHYRGKIGKRYVHIVSFHFTRDGKRKSFYMHFNTGVKATPDEKLALKTGMFREVDDFDRFNRGII